MVINLDGGKVNLSIKRLEPKPQQTGRPSFRREGGEGRPERPDRGNFRRENNNQQRPAPVRAAAPVPPPAPKTKDQQFEDMMKAFMSESDSKLSGMRADHRTKSRRR
jgi:predicted RNA-binding protein with RPS1 domain